MHLLAPLRPDLADGELRLAVHAAIGAIQSTLFFRSGLAPGRLEELLDAMAHGCLASTPLLGAPSSRSLSSARRRLPRLSPAATIGGQFGDRVNQTATWFVPLVRTYRRPCRCSAPLTRGQVQGREMQGC